jgi:hypothetical protein
MNISTFKVRQVCVQFEQLRAKSTMSISKQTRASSRIYARSIYEAKRPTEGQVEFLQDPATLMAWSGLTLEERQVMFHRRYGDKKISRYYLRKAYKEAGIRKKKVRKTKIPSLSMKAKQLEQLQLASSQLEESREQGYRIVYLDEMMTTIHTLPTHEWSPLKTPFAYDASKLKDQTIATIAAISLEKGVDLVAHYHKSVNVERFIDFLGKLRERYPNDKLALFMDQLSVHRSKPV